MRRSAKPCRHCTPELDRGKRPLVREVPASKLWPGTNDGSPIWITATMLLETELESWRSTSGPSVDASNESRSRFERPEKDQGEEVDEPKPLGTEKPPNRPDDPHNVSPTT